MLFGELIQCQQLSSYDPAPLHSAKVPPAKGLEKVSLVAATLLRARGRSSASFFLSCGLADLRVPFLISRGTGMGSRRGVRLPSPIRQVRPGCRPFSGWPWSPKTNSAARVSQGD